MEAFDVNTFEACNTCCAVISERPRVECITSGSTELIFVSRDFGYI